MNITSLTSNIGSGLLQKLLANTSSTGSVSATSSTSSADQVLASADGTQGVSKMGEQMKKLDDLSSSDPAKFKQVTGNIAEQLKGLANSKSGEEAERINDMASKFESASKSGSMSDLKPPGPPPNGGPPPQGAAAYAQQKASASNSSTDTRSQIDSIVEQALTSGVSSS
jgi:hypothetical protein